MSEDKDDLWNEAMALLLRWQVAPDSITLQSEVKAFCKQSDAHLAAWDSAKRVYRLTGQVALGNNEQKPVKLNRRAVLGGLAALAVTAGAAPFALRRFGADIATDVAQIDRRPLEDGSVLVLGPYSTARLSFSASLRQVELIEGLAYCEVSPDDPRPFELMSHGFSATAMLGRFEMRHNRYQTLVGVADGAVVVKTGTGEISSLRDNEWIAAVEGKIRRGKRPPDKTAGWQANVLIADGDPIISVVSEIERWRGGEIFIPQASLAAAPVSGVFDLNEPDTALAAVVAPYGGKVRNLSPWIRVLTTV